jgi:hypothetical protein
MKNKNSWIRILFVLVVSGLLLNGCNYEDDPVSTYNSNTQNNPIPPNTCTTELIAGQNINVGGVTVWNDADYIYVQYTTTGDWWITETHLHIATDLNGIPQTRKGNPKVGKFDYQTEHDPSVQTYTYTIPIPTGWSYEDSYVIAAHAVVQNSIQVETAWGEGFNFPGGSWAMYFDCTLISPCNEWIIYGSNLGTGTGGDALYKIDLNAKTRTLVYDPGAIIDASQNYPNANAYDAVNQRVYFGTQNGRLFYHEIGSGTHVQVATSFGTMACGAWYNGKYYYVQNGTNRLYEVTITGTTASRNQIGTVPTSNGYGDIVFDPHNPGVFVGSAGNVWYAYNFNTNTKVTLTKSGDGGTNHKQLAYGSDGVLYAVQATSGEFFTVVYSFADKTVTLTSFWNSGYPFTDLASGPQCQ